MEIWMTAVTLTECALIAWCALQQRRLQQVEDHLENRSGTAGERDRFDHEPGDPQA